MRRGEATWSDIFWRSDRGQNDSHLVQTQPPEPEMLALMNSTRTFHPVIPIYQPLIKGISLSPEAGGAILYICGLGSDRKLVIYSSRLGRWKERTESSCRICEHLPKWFFFRVSLFLETARKKPVFEDEAFISSIEMRWGCISIIEEIRFLFFPARTNVYKCGAGGVPW